jgi:hypothetical protein
MTEERRITLRVPGVLASRLDKSVGERQGEYPKFSMNDWIVEAIREKVDAQTEADAAIRSVAPGVVAEPLFQAKLTQEGLLARIPGLKTGRTLVDPETGD